jgi:hypothetical protein
MHFLSFRAFVSTTGNFLQLLATPANKVANTSQPGQHEDHPRFHRSRTLRPCGPTVLATHFNCSPQLPMPVRQKPPAHRHSDPAQNQQLISNNQRWQHHHPLCLEACRACHAHCYVAGYPVAPRRPRSARASPSSHPSRQPLTSLLLCLIRRAGRRNSHITPLRFVTGDAPLPLRNASARV